MTSWSPISSAFEKLCGTSGKAGNLRGDYAGRAAIRSRVRGQNEYPNKPLIMSQAGLIFTEGARSSAGIPSRRPSSNNSAAYTNIEGQTLAPANIAALRIFRLRVQFQGEPEHLHHAGADGR
jgi:gluconate 2-dehydrogenase alpha chain